VTAAVRRHTPYVALTDGALWLTRGGVAWRVALEDVVLATVVGASDGSPAVTPDPVPDGALRVDFVSGDPLVLLVVDGGVFQDRLAREIYALDRELQRGAPGASVIGGLRPDRGVPARGPDGPHGRRGPQGPHEPRCPQQHGPDGAAELLHDAELVVLRELRRVLTGDRSTTGRSVR